MKYGITFLISGTFGTVVEAPDEETALKIADKELDKVCDNTDELLNIIGSELHDIKELTPCYMKSHTTSSANIASK